MPVSSESDAKPMIISPVARKRPPVLVGTASP